MLTDDKLKTYLPKVYCNAEMTSAQQVWLEWYKGYTKLHTYTTNDGIRVRSRKLPTLKMASRVAEDWVSTLLSEDWQIDVTSSKGVKIQKATSAFVQGSNGEKGVLGSSNFKTLLNDTLERTFALGSGAICLTLDNLGIDEYGFPVKTDNTKINFNAYNCFEIKPISWNNGRITECAFTSERTQGKDKYDILTTYTLDYDKTYVITNRVFKDGKEVTAEEIGLISVIRTNSTLPWFFIFKTAKANSIDFNSPLGESVYSDALDILYMCDLTYACLKQEVITGRRLVLFNKSLLTVDEQGNPVCPDDNFQSYFQFFSDEMSSDVKDFVKEFHPTLNVDKLNEELQLNLNLLSSKCGLGKNTYQLKEGTEITATEARLDNKSASKNIKRQSIMLQQTLQQIIQTVINIGVNIFEMGLDEDAKVSVTLRTTTTDDIEMERQRDLELVKEKIMTVNEYRKKWMPELGELQDESSKLEDKSSEVNNS
jgi:A118 family predicted phage portal protein